MKFRFRMRPSVSCLLCISLLSGPAGVVPASAQNLPNLGDESATALPPQLEKRIGESYYRDLRRDPVFLDDPELTAYVTELGRRLIAAGPDPGMEVEFFVMRDPSINAFAMLGGYIGVNTGLITASQGESEVASVFGHEIAHLTQHHIARSVSAGQRASIVSMIALALAILAARSNSQVAAGAAAGAQAFQVQSQLAYSRDFEREADRVGFDMLQKAGFDVSAMPLFFERLQRAGRVYDSTAPVYVRSHPLTTERIADIRNRAQEARYRQHVDTLSYHLVRAKLRATGDGGVDAVRDALGFFKAQISNRSFNNEAATRYGLAQANLLAREFGAAAQALAALPQSVAHPMIDALAARIKTGAGDLPGAIDTYRRALAKFPHARYLETALVEALQGAGRHDEALELLAAQQVRGPHTDPRVFELKARSHAALGKPMSQHQALGEYYFRTSSAQAALEQFQLARCAGGGDFYQQSIIDARIRDTWERLVTERADRGEGDKSGAAGGGARGAQPVQQIPMRCR